MEKLIYAKIITEETIEFPPVNREDLGILNYNLNYEQLAKDGYKPLIRAERPNDGSQYKTLYSCEDDKIIERHVVIPPAVAPEPAPPTYAEKRAALYPDPREFLDAQVKLNSGDPLLAEAGRYQLEAYCHACLGIKRQFPKPEEN